MEEKTAIVLSGGGAKGAYEIGVWKALKKLKIKYDIVTGTSVGALNGAFMVQKDYMKAVKMWQNINFDMIFKDGFEGDINTFAGIKDLIAMYGKGILNGGMDVSKLEETINNYINVNKFYKSKIDYGLVTVNLSNLKPISLTKDNIKEDLLKDYLMASATCFPAFKLKKIDNKNYIDGGYYDNLPISLAVKMGATKIIAIDIGSKSRKAKKITTDVPITYIKPKNDIGSFLVFDSSLATRNIKLGFNDTMKEYGKYDGDKLTFKKGTTNKLINDALPMIKDLLETLVKINKNNKLLVKEEKQINKYKDMLLNDDKLKENIIEAIDTLGIALEINETVVYSKSSYYKAIKDSYTKIGNIDFDELVTLFEKKDFYKLLDSKIIIKYGYQVLMRNWDKRFLTMMLLANKEFFACLYLMTILK